MKVCPGADRFVTGGGRKFDAPPAFGYPSLAMLTSSIPDSDLVAALRQGDESAFQALVEQHHASLVRLASFYTNDRAAAEEVAQETWIGVLRGLDRFEGRSSLKTWIFTILANRAKTRGQRESRSIPFSALADAEADGDDPAVEPGRFLTAGQEPVHPGHWTQAPHNWGGLPEARVLSRETLTQVQAAIDALPPAQGQVITLRDVKGLSAAEVCNILEISETNQRVLLHRARAKVRRALASYLDQDSV